MVVADAEYTNLSYDNLGLTGKLYPNPDPEHSDGTMVMFGEKFNTDDGLAHLVPAEWLPAKELPDDEYPFVLNTGRLLEHWHTGSMTRRSFALDAIQPRGPALHAPEGRSRAGARRRRMVRVSSRRGTIELEVKVAPRAARQLLHPVPLPRGGREPAHDRRDRPVGQDPRVQVLRGADRARRRPELAATDRGRPKVRPGVEARAGKFPGPCLIPALNAIQREHGWLPREELVRLSRETRRPRTRSKG